jgi:hypothetical protein
MNLRRVRLLSLIGLVAVITCLLCDDQAVRYSAAALVAVGAVPWWRALRDFFRRQAFSDLTDSLLPTPANRDSHECGPVPLDRR